MSGLHMSLKLRLGLSLGLSLSLTLSGLVSESSLRLVVGTGTGTLGVCVHQSCSFRCRLSNSLCGHDFFAFSPLQRRGSVGAQGEGGGWKESAS